MLSKIRDFMDTNVDMVILIDDIEMLTVITNVIVSIGRDRCVYELYKDNITAYMIEIRMPYNRYLKLMQGLKKKGYNLRPESKADIFNRMFKEKG